MRMFSALHSSKCSTGKRSFLQLLAARGAVDGAAGINKLGRKLATTKIPVSQRFSKCSSVDLRTCSKFGQVTYSVRNTQTH